MQLLDRFDRNRTFVLNINDSYVRDIFAKQIQKKPNSEMFDHMRDKMTENFIRQFVSALKNKIDRAIDVKSKIEIYNERNNRTG